MAGQSFVHTSPINFKLSSLKGIAEAGSGKPDTKNKWEQNLSWLEKLLCYKEVQAFWCYIIRGLF